MADLYNTVNHRNMTTAFGGTIAGTDTLHFQEWATKYNAGLDLSSIDLVGIDAAASFTGDVGDGSARMLVDVDHTASSKCYIGFGGRAWYMGAGTGGTINELVFVPLLSDALLDLANATLTTLVVQCGVVRMNDTLDLVNGYFYGGDSFLDADGAAFTLVEVGNAILRLRRDGTTIKAKQGGRVIVDDYDVSPTNLYVDGGVVEWGGGAIANLYGRVGVLDCSKMPRDVTIAGGTIGPGLTIKLPPKGITLDYSACTLLGGGPQEVAFGVVGV